MKPPVWRVGVADLRRRWGSRRELSIEGELEGGLALSSSYVPPGATVRAAIVLEALPASVVATGIVEAPWVGPCRRCLREVTGTLESDVRDVFDARPIEGETYPIEDDHIDLEPMVRDAVLLALPLAPLCEAGCRGPDPDAFPVLEPAEPEVVVQPRDPRWAALDQLDFD